ncbi:MAG: sigma-70 family RNA polymerase sigma factor [Pseudomonadota bacterium]
MFADALEKILPDLRGFARMLCGDAARADDIVQNACLKAWDARDSFCPDKGSFKAWMMTIARNEFLQEIRKHKRVDCYAPSDLEDWLAEDCYLDHHAECSDAIRHVFLLPPDQRDVFILVIAMGYSYEEAARICACSIGTIKSRINRARAKLQLLRDDPAEVLAASAMVASAPQTIGDLYGYASQLVQSAA